MILNMIQMPICTCFRMELTVAFLLELNCDRISILQSKYYLVSPKEQRTRSYEEAGWPKGESNFIRERNENSSIPVRRYSCRKLQSPDWLWSSLEIGPGSWFSSQSKSKIKMKQRLTEMQRLPRHTGLLQNLVVSPGFFSDSSFILWMFSVTCYRLCHLSSFGERLWRPPSKPVEFRYQVFEADYLCTCWDEFWLQHSDSFKLSNETCKASNHQGKSRLDRDV